MSDISLQDVWNQQEEYNDKIRTLNSRTKAEWMTNYIIGLIGELGELLEEIKWKSHRANTIPEFGYNVQEEMADITKYVLSMWQLLGATDQDMLDAVYRKGKMLEQLLRQESNPKLFGKNILMLDLDGVVADFRWGFFDWLQDSKWKNSLQILEDQAGLHLDINNNWEYSLYAEAKLAFEIDGGYRHLPPLANMQYVIGMLRRAGWYIIVYTARPYSEYRRVWTDTWDWIVEHKLEVDEIHFGYDKRVITAQELSVYNNVIALEDDPVMIDRYYRSKIPTFVVPQPYNSKCGYDFPRIDLKKDITSIFSTIHKHYKKEENLPWIATKN